MSYYSIKPKLNTNLCLNVSGTGVASNGRNVNVYQSTGSNDQKWFIYELATNQKVLSAINQAYGLNALRTGTWNCNIRVVGGNDNDSSVDFIPAGDGYYYIKLTNYGDYYLQCTGSSSGSNVIWHHEFTGGDAQKWLIVSTTVNGPASYAYMTATYNGCTLHIIRTDASNLKLVNLQKEDLSEAGVIGINGGFFNISDSNCVQVYNVAKYNGSYVGPESAPYDGSHNRWCGNGIIFRTASGDMQFVEGQDCLTEANLSVVKNLTGTGSWAQGGAGMYLGKSDWVAEANNMFPHPMGTSYLGRSALVVDTNTGFAYLIVNASQTITYISFRAAIETFLNLTDGSVASTRYFGLILDGGGSSGLRAVTPSNNAIFIHKNGEIRKLCEVIALIDTN